jgi:hypothetical protein
MDINSAKGNQLPGRTGSNKTEGIVDLRHFASAKKNPGASETGKVFYEIKPTGAYGKKNEKIQNFAEAGKIETEALSSKNGVIETTCHSEDLSEQKKNKTEKKPKLSSSLPSFPKAALRRPSSTKNPSFPKSFRRVAEPEKPKFHHKKSFAHFAISSFLIPVLILSFAFAQAQLEQRAKVLGESAVAYDNLKSAAGYAFASDFANTQENFDSANLNFAKARETIDGIGLGIGEAIGNLPVNTPISTAQNLTSAGENISLAGKDMSEMMEKISSQTESGEGNKLSLTALTGIDGNLKNISAHLSAANDNMQKVNTEYIPKEMQEKINLAKETLPGISENFERLVADYPLILKMLGGERAQKYLLLFENNSEMRATGGFIGSYGILDIENGKMENMQIDGIFDPDGQLQEKIVPPMPIQKISAAWSMHDSNWFADFPTSAKKAALFYEKTGGPTVDGVIAITPETLKKLLEITGPIDMPAYSVTITPDNFVAETQNQVENLYDKTENKPKKILGDLAPIIMEKLFKDDSLGKEARVERLFTVVQKLEESLQEKQILIYHRDDSVENMIQKRGWGGEIIQNQKGDYLAVINTNINGYKTDAVIDESIKLDTEIKEDGSIIDTLTVSRKHLGGDKDYDWYNRVNADYMRVYVPKGSILLSASGNTVEQYASPMDYSNFKTDPDVVAEEKTIKIDPQSQTQIFEETGKTVFGNWIYVSPKEEVTVTYKYELPFNIDFNSFTKSADAYSAIIQKQAGSIGSNFETTIKFPEKWQSAWKTNDIGNGNNISEKLTKDLIYGMIFVRKS